MGCFIGCLSRKKRIKSSENLKQREQVEISMEEGVAESDTDSVYGNIGSGGQRPALRGAMSSVLEFNLEDLLRASAEVLAKGVLGTTYKAFLDTGTTMVVKRMKDFPLSERQFGEMVEAIEKINHENLFPLKASYFSKDEKLLVHDFMPMGSLSAVLHGKRGASRTPLNWDTRIGIALGAARAIAHLHSLRPSISHGSIKSSNVLLTSTFEAHVSDYGLAKFAAPAPAADRINGYSAPEFTKISHKADVYSYGVLFLELLTGKNPDESYLQDEGLDLPRWMLLAINDEWTSEVFDVELLQYGNLEEVLLQLLELAFSCTVIEPYNRPSMAEVISRIEMLCCSSLQVDEMKHIFNVEDN